MTPIGIAFYLLPGLWLAWRGERLRALVERQGRAPRVGVRLVQPSALGFAARGLFMPARAGAGTLADATALATRLHALGWSLWWIAFFAGGVLLALSARQGKAFAAASLAAAVLVPAIALWGPAWAGPRPAAWLANAVWLGWWAFALLRRPRGD